MPEADSTIQTHNSLAAERSVSEGERTAETRGGATRLRQSRRARSMNTRQSSQSPFETFACL